MTKIIEWIVIACFVFPLAVFATSALGQELREEERLGSVTFSAAGVMNVRTEKVILKGDEVIARENHRRVFDPADDFASEVKAELYQVAPMGIPVETFVDAMWTPTNIAERRKIRGTKPDGTFEQFVVGKPTPQADMAREPALGSPHGNPHDNPTFVENAEMQARQEQERAKAEQAVADDERLKKEDDLRRAQELLKQKMETPAPIEPAKPAAPAQ